VTGVERIVMKKYLCMLAYECQASAFVDEAIKNERTEE